MYTVSFILHSNSSTSSEIQNVPTGIEVCIGNIPKNIFYLTIGYKNIQFEYFRYDCTSLELKIV